MSRPIDPRVLHARVLERRPALEDLEEPARQVAEACLIEENSEVCQWGHANLPAQEWTRVQEVLAEARRRNVERAAVLVLCRQGNADALGELYPGHLAFYEQASSPPLFFERPMDAVVLIGASALARRGTGILERKMAKEALLVQRRSVGSRSRFYPGPESTLSTQRFFYGYYTPSIERRMNERRPLCERSRSSPYAQGACRRDLTVSIVRDWLESRGHRSVRFVLGDQTAWPEYDLLFQRMLPKFQAAIDKKFHTRLPFKSTFVGEVCGFKQSRTLWSDYEFYARTLLSGDT